MKNKFWFQLSEVICDFSLHFMRNALGCSVSISWIWDQWMWENCFYELENSTYDIFSLALRNFNKRTHLIFLMFCSKLSHFVQVLLFDNWITGQLYYLIDALLDIFCQIFGKTNFNSLLFVTVFINGLISFCFRTRVNPLILDMLKSSSTILVRVMSGLVLGRKTNATV